MAIPYKNYAVLPYVFFGTEPTYLDRYEVYVDERNTAQGEDVSDAEYLEMLRNSGAENMIAPQTASESTIAALLSLKCKSIGANVLTYCDSLKTITYDGTIAQWNAIEKPKIWMSCDSVGSEFLLLTA